MTMGWPLVVRLKKARSSGRCQGRSPPRPMMRSEVMATRPVRWRGLVIGLLVIGYWERGGLDRDGGLDVGVGVVVFEFEVFEGEGVDVADGGVDGEGGEGAGVAGELEAGLVEMVGVEVEVAEGVDEVARFVVEGLGDHHGEEGVGGDVEGDAEEEVGAALVELAGEAGALAVLFGLVDVELEEEVAGREGHLVDLPDVPGGDEMAAGVGVVLEAVHEAGDLVDGRSVLGLPGAPLLSVDGAEFAMFIGPIVPDADAVFLEVGDVGVAFEEPEEFVDDGAEVEFFGGEAGESVPEVEAGLAAEDREGAGAGAVGAFFAMLKDIPEEVEVLLHGGEGGGGNGESEG